MQHLHHGGTAAYCWVRRDLTWDCIAAHLPLLPPHQMCAARQSDHSVVIMRQPTTCLLSSVLLLLLLLLLCAEHGVAGTSSLHTRTPGTKDRKLSQTEGACTMQARVQMQ